MKNSAFLLMCLVFHILYTKTESSCSSNQARCADDLKCIPTTSLCNYLDDCADGSDEQPEFCEVYSAAKNENGGCGSNGQFKCTNRQCHYFPNFCTSCGAALSNSQKNLCRMLTGDGKLNFDTKPETINSNITYNKVLTEINKNFNYSSFCNISLEKCPPLYTRVENLCLSFFSVSRITWFDAQNFCKSINGHLAIMDNLTEFFNIVKYINKKELRGDFWIGGKYSVKIGKPSSWRWTDESTILSGAPFWSISREQLTTCSPRDQTEKCSRAPIHPLENSVGRCVAMTFKNRYYFTDHNCFESKSPLCIYNE